MKAGEGRLLVRASATILCVRNGMSLTNPALTLDYFAHKIAAGVERARKFAAHWIFIHSYTCQIVFIDFSGGVLLVAKILEDITRIKGLLPGLAGSNKFGFGSRQRYVVLTAILPRDRSDVHHEDVTGV